MFLLDIAENADVVRGVVGWTDFDAADGVARIDALAARKLLVGLRPMVQDIEDDDWLLGPVLALLLTAMTRNGLVLDALGSGAVSCLRRPASQSDGRTLKMSCVPHVASVSVTGWRSEKRT